MSATEETRTTQTMPFAVRPLTEADVAQSAEIERDAFPTLFPPTSFRRELKNRLARYIVAWRRDDLLLDPEFVDETTVEATDGEKRPLISRIIHSAWSVIPGRPTTWEPGQTFIAGFLGVWYMTDEAHIVSVGVRTELRGQGIGELLLIGAIEQAMERKARTVTLEVRVSNYVAQNLYKKYGFQNMGVRKGYYTDNREDALIMTTSPINESPYPEDFRELVFAHTAKWGPSERVVL